MRRMEVFLLLTALASSTAVPHTQKRPHIVFILADDIGRGDISMYGSPQIPTPNMDALACDGIVLNNFYVQHVCSPSRGSLMTGLYAIHTGLQHRPLSPGQISGLPLNLKILPEHLKDLGYETHLVGKWHLGYSSLNYTPTYRGFDSFYGQYSGPVDYFSNVLTFPMFLLLAHQATHCSYGEIPVAAPTENTEKFPYIGNVNRTTYAGMVDSLDESIGSLLEALEEASMLEESIIIFSTDNGAAPEGYHANFGSNWPLRGIKGTVWEGGVRAPAFIWSPRLQRSGTVSQQLMHITDWLPTLYSAAGGHPQHLGELDGLDLWRALSRGTRSPRSEILLNIDSERGTAGLRYAEYKLVTGIFGEGLDGRHEIPGGSRPHEDLHHLLQQSRAASVLRRFYRKKSAFRCRRGFWSGNAAVNCGRSQETNFVTGEEHYLFDIARDPCELTNLAHKRPDLLSFMLGRLKTYNETAVRPIDRTFDPKGFPENNGGLWGPWLG
ncbi:arylsulfatase B-like isoform X2 [Haemaphysalis longicornis]